MIPAAAIHGTTSASVSSSFPAKSGRKTSGPSAAPKSAPKRTYEIPRARRSGGYMSAAAARASRIVPCAIPTSAKPGITSAAVSTLQPSAVVRQPAIPATHPPASTGTRPYRSIRRPAGSAARAPAVRKIAGPSPRIPSISVTRTSVTVPTATASWTMPESDVSVAASRIVLRRTGKRSICSTLSEQRLRRGRPGTPRRRRARGGGRTGRRAGHARAGRSRRPGGRRRAREGTSPIASISARVGWRFDSAVPGCVGTRFQSRTPSSSPSSASVRCTIVAVASAGPLPDSWRSDVNGIPETRAPR